MRVDRVGGSIHADFEYAKIAWIKASAARLPAYRQLPPLETMRYLRGRALNVPLASGKEEAVSQLERRGFPEPRAQAVANAATQFANEETQHLERQLSPKATWPGLVICRRSVVGAQDTVWLTLRYEQKAGWMLDSALFE